MSGRQKWARYRGQWSSARLAVLGLVCLAGLARTVHAQQRREREPNSVYAERRARLAAQVDAPIILWGFTGREEVSQAYIFAQEDNFYYLTGHNEEGAGLILLPTLKNRATGDVWDGPREMFFLPEKNPAKEKWNGARIAPSDPGVEAPTGFAAVKPFAEMRANVEKLATWRLPARERGSGLASARGATSQAERHSRANQCAPRDQIARRNRFLETSD